MSAGAEGLPWPEGDPGALRASAGRLASIGHGLTHAAGRLARATGRGAGWSSPAASAFTALASRQLDALRGGATDLDAAARAVRELADAVEAAQRTVREQAALVHDARVAAEAEPPPDPLLPSPLGSLDPGDRARARYAAVRTTAEVLARQAVQDVEDADRRCSGWLEGVGRILVAGPGGVPSAPSGGGFEWTCPTDDPAVRSLFDGLSAAGGFASTGMKLGTKPLPELFTDDVDGRIRGGYNGPLNDFLDGQGACRPGDFQPPNPPPPPPPPPHPVPVEPSHPDHPFWPDSLPTPADGVRAVGGAADDAWHWYDQANTDAADWTRGAASDVDDWVNDNIPAPGGSGPNGAPAPPPPPPVFALP